MVNFCPQCGQRVETVFNFCPSCGGRLPPQEEEPMQITPSPSLKGLHQEIQVHLQRLPVEKKMHLFLPEEEKASASVKQGLAQTSAVILSPKAKAKLSSRSPRKDKSALVKPLPEGQTLTDLNDKQWILKKLLTQNDHGMMYEAKSASGACCPKQRYTLKLDCKEGRIFNEQNFLQRAAKKVSEKWKKQHLVPLLGIPECVGFGLHNGCYRFLVFSNLGRSLQSILDDCANKMTEKAALQLAVRLLDVLEYLHENEYTHGNLAAENIYVNPADLTAVTLADYYFAFRYSPGGKHVSQREGSRTPHEGNLEFISLDSHKGAAPSRRSDLESLGYCLVKWLCGSLPWSEELANPCAVMEKKERYKSDVIKHPRLSYGWKAIPEALQGYLLQVMPLEYDEKPDYEELQTLLKRPLLLMKTDAYDSVDLRVAP
ncbi:inactive serine/threonine-protein kinase VRK3 isoform X2 [Sceloporus undulatus]|uniref:inactive serine/threonine-protein kinase VRK3 isoform X2 n=1 Tax=Sceloporus undulatus TaxID=8520 RepID=UPI001C4A7CCD|nr:inactive serine/threonine-protein kinase VRK3 isoform X2 [Sceloporus undulatus]